MMIREGQTRNLRRSRGGGSFGGKGEQTVLVWLVLPISDGGGEEEYNFSFIRIVGVGSVRTTEPLLFYFVLRVCMCVCVFSVCVTNEFPLSFFTPFYLRRSRQVLEL